MTPTIRPARAEDIDAILAIYATDTVGGHPVAATPEDRAAVAHAFRRIEASPDNAVFVAELEGRVVGTFQITILPGLVAAGRTRAKLESVHVHADMRGKGVGAVMLAFAEAEALSRGAGIVELSSNAKRLDAHRFYERAGYEKSHVAFKKVLSLTHRP
jgi:GNAT superfamily N-acetyltransferase